MFRYDEFDHGCWRIIGSFRLCDFVFIAGGPDRFVEFSELERERYDIEYLIEILKNSEPEIIGITFYRFDKVIPVGAALKAQAEEFLLSNHDMWTRMREHVLEYGEREYEPDAEEAA